MEITLSFQTIIAVGSVLTALTSVALQGGSMINNNAFEG